MRIQLIIAAAAMAIGTGCASISDEAGQVAIIDESFQLDFLDECRKVGNVVTEATGFGKRVRLDNAYVGLRESAADLGADTVMVTTSYKETFGPLKVYGRAYDCNMG